MANYSTQLKDWGSTGTSHPDGYSHVAGEQPVDVWENFVKYNLIKDVKALINLTNDRFESDTGTSRPGSPEVAHQFYDTDDDKLELYTGTVWHRLLYADGDSMSGALDMAGNTLNDSSGTLNVGADISVTGKADVDGSGLHDGWAYKQEGGTIATGSAVPIWTFGLAAGETLNVTQAMLTKDGFTTPCLSGIDLVIAPEGAVDSTDTTTILSGDGATLYDDETGSPLATYTNNTAGHQTVVIALDNGQWNAGSGADNSAFGGIIARVV